MEKRRAETEARKTDSEEEEAAPPAAKKCKISKNGDERTHRERRAAATDKAGTSPSPTPKRARAAASTGAAATGYRLESTAGQATVPSPGKDGKRVRGVDLR